MKFTGTLRFRLSFLFSLSLTVMAVIILAILLQRIERRMLEDIDGLVYDHIGYLHQFIEDEIETDHEEHREEQELNEQLHRLSEELFDNLIHSPLQNEAYIIANREGHTILNKTLSDEYAQIDLHALGDYPIDEMITIHSDQLNYPIRFIALEIFNDYKFIVITSLESYTKQVRGIKIYFITAALLMIFIGGAIAWITIGRSMKGVLLVTKAAGEFGHGDLKARVSWTGKGNEIEELIAHFNQMATQTESLIKEMGEITNNIAHDLRTPVTRMRGLAENTLTKNPENSLLASNVIEECERQAAIIEDTLSLAESQAGVLKLKLQKCHINELLTEMAEIYQPLLEQEESKFSTLLPQSPIYLFIDPRRVQRVIANLLDNAIKYAPKSTITLSLIETTEQVEIRVTDNGPGIPQQDRDNIFKRFFRADKSRNSTGSGLGLSLARSYMENHGGTLELENTNDGCSFLICFPKNK